MTSKNILNQWVKPSHRLVRKPVFIKFKLNHLTQSLGNGFKALYGMVLEQVYSVEFGIKDVVFVIRLSTKVFCKRLVLMLERA